MSITYGDHLIDSGYYDITPEQEREIEAREECERRDIDPDELVADGGVEAWMVVAQERFSEELDPEIAFPSDDLLRRIHLDVEVRGRKNPDFAVTVHHRNIVLSAVAHALRKRGCSWEDWLVGCGGDDHAGACKTCGGRGEVGGFVNADSGFQTDPCPDCAPSTLPQEQART